MSPTVRTLLRWLLVAFATLFGVSGSMELSAQLLMPGEGGCLRAMPQLVPEEGGKRPPREGRRENTTGDSELDSQLGRALVRLSRTFGVTPGFSIDSRFENEQYRRNAFAIPRTQASRTKGTVVFGDVLFDELMQKPDEGITILAVLAHEFAHIKQFFTPRAYRVLRPGSKTKRLELHADLLAGYYLGLQKRRLPNINLQIAGEHIVSIGDYAFDRDDHHGTPHERIIAAEKGFSMAENGVSFQEAFDAGIRFVLAIGGAAVLLGNPLVLFLLRIRTILLSVIAISILALAWYRFEARQDSIEAEVKSIEAEVKKSREYSKSSFEELTRIISEFPSDSVGTPPRLGGLPSVDGLSATLGIPQPIGKLDVHVGDRQKGYAVISRHSKGTTKCGTRFDDDDVFAAHYKFGCGTELQVRNFVNKKQIDVIVWESAGSEQDWTKNIICLSRKAAEELGIVGRAQVEVVVKALP